MLKCCSLYSGSTGNSFFVQTEKTKILIDAGVSCRKIETALKTLQVSPNEINAILVTHEHIDHTKSIGTYFGVTAEANSKWTTITHIPEEKHEVVLPRTGK